MDGWTLILRCTFNLNSISNFQKLFFLFSAPAFAPPIKPTKNGRGVGGAERRESGTDSVIKITPGPPTTTFSFEILCSSFGKSTFVITAISSSIMNLAQKASVLVALFALSSADAFAVHRPSSTSSRLHSTIESSSSSAAAAEAALAEVGYVTTSLVPPSKLAAAHTTSELFDTRVQKTYGRYPITFVSGSGSTLTDDAGREYLDFVSGIATCALGHNNPELTEAVSSQMRKVHHVSNLYYTPGQAQLANWLCENSCADKAFFCNSGAEANEAAIKLARRHAYNRGITVSVSGAGGWRFGCVYLPPPLDVERALLSREEVLSMRGAKAKDAPRRFPSD